MLQQAANITVRFLKLDLFNTLLLIYYYLLFMLSNKLWNLREYEESNLIAKNLGN